MSKEHNIPQQHTGAQTDTSARVELDTREEAVQRFRLAKQRLLDVSNWDKICGPASARFCLTDSSGNEVHRTAHTGDYFKIDIPAPGPGTGEGHDWVQIEQIDDQSNTGAEQEYIAIRVRPAPRPGSAAGDTAHFFKDQATSTFLAERNGNTVRAEVHGRNETPNTDAHSVLDTVRNAIVAIGAMIGISTPQWKSLVNGLVKEEK